MKLMHRFPDAIEEHHPCKMWGCMQPTHDQHNRFYAWGDTKYIQLACSGRKFSALLAGVGL